MERKIRSPKEEKLTNPNKLESPPSRQIIPFDRFPNFNKWATHCRLQQNTVKNSDNRNSDRDGKYEKYPIRKSGKNLDTKNPNGEGAYNKNKVKSGERNEKINKKPFKDYSYSADGVKPLAKKDKLSRKDSTTTPFRKRPHTASPILQKMTNARLDSIRTKHFNGVIENKSVIMDPKLKKENVCEKKLAGQNKPLTPSHENRPGTPNLQNKPLTPNQQNRPNTPNIQKRPNTTIPQNRPNSSKLLFRNEDYGNSRGDKKIQKIVEKVDGSCVFIKSAVIETKNEKLLKKNHANVQKRSQCAFKTLQKIKDFTDSIRTRRMNIIANQNSDTLGKIVVTNEADKNKLVEGENLEANLKTNIQSKVSVKSNRSHSADGKLQSTDSLNNFVDEMERSFLNKNFTYTPKEQKNNNFLEVPKLENITSQKKSNVVRPQTANVLLQRTVGNTNSYRNFVNEMERCYPRYNFGEVTKQQKEITKNKSFDIPNAEKQTEGNKNKGDTEIKNLAKNNLPQFSQLNQDKNFEDDFLFENKPTTSKSLSYLKSAFDIGEDQVHTSHTILREKIEQYVKVCVPDICGKRIIKSIEGKIDDLERIINKKLKIGYESTDLGNHFSIFQKNETADAFKPLDTQELSEKFGNTSNKLISNAGLIRYMEDKISAYEKKYSYNFCNEAFITNLQDKVDALQKCIPMILNVEKPNCQDAQCFTSDLSLQGVAKETETQLGKVHEQELSEVWDVAVEDVESKKGSEHSNLDTTSFKSADNYCSKPLIAKQNRIQDNIRQGDKPTNTIEDAKKVLAQAQNLFTPQKVSLVKSYTAVEGSKQQIAGGINKNFSLINTRNTQKAAKIEEYTNFLRKYKIVKFEDLNSNKTQLLPTSKEEKKTMFSKILNVNMTDPTTSSNNKAYEETCAERHAEVIENLQKRIAHFKNSSRISELRSKIDEIKTSISRVTNNSKNPPEANNNDVSVICSVKDYLEESDSVMETSCEDIVKVTEDITNLDEEIKRCKTQLAFYQSNADDERNRKSPKLLTVSEGNSRYTFSPRTKSSHRTHQRPKSANMKYSKTAFGGITKIIKNLQSKMDQHERFYQSCNGIASALSSSKEASLDQNSSVLFHTNKNVQSSNMLLRGKESDIISAQTIENLKLKVDSLTETCNVSNIRELQNKLENIEKACSIVKHADIIRTLQTKIEKLETTLENQTKLVRNQDSTETLYSCSSSRTFSSESRLSRNSKNLFDEMPACTYCMAVTLDHKPNLLNWDKN